METSSVLWKCWLKFSSILTSTGTVPFKQVWSIFSKRNFQGFNSDPGQDAQSRMDFAVLLIRITLIRIRILPFNLVRIRILSFNLMLILVLSRTLSQIWTLQCSKWPSKASTFSLWCSGSGSCFSLWCGCGSGSSFSKSVFRIHDILGWIRILLFSSLTFTMPAKN